MGNRYFDLLDEADDDPEVRVIVVTGADAAFCVGMDASSLAEAAGQGLRRRPAKGRRMTHAMEIRKPLIAAINGACAGFGLVQALHCDIRFAARGAVFSTAFVRRGLNAEYGSSWLLPRIVGHARATELLLSARRFDASEAERIGLVHWAVPDEELSSRVHAYACELAVWCSPRAMADTKRQLEQDWLNERRLAEDRAKQLGHRPGHRIDFLEGVQSYAERRPPRFAPLPPSSGDRPD
jgi:enoyl-CoA hydratase/carnithine racemase